MDYGSQEHFKILALLVSAGAFINISDHSDLSDFLTMRKRTRQRTISNFEVVRRIVRKEFDETEKDVVCPLQVMKYMIQHNTLLPKRNGTDRG